VLRKQLLSYSTSQNKVIHFQNKTTTKTKQNHNKTATKQQQKQNIQSKQNTAKQNFCDFVVNHT